MKISLPPIAILTIGIWMVSCSSVQAKPGKYQYLAYATEILMTARLKGSDVSLEEFAIAMSVGCERLQHLLSRSESKWLVDNDELDHSGAKKVLTDSDRFANYLLGERVNLLSMGVSYLTAIQALTDISSNRIPGIKSNRSGQEIFKSIIALANATCRIADQVPHDVDVAKRVFYILIISRGMLGATLATGETAFAWQQGDHTSASIVVGGVLLDDALSNLSIQPEN